MENPNTWTPLEVRLNQMVGLEPADILDTVIEEGLLDEGRREEYLDALSFASIRVQAVLEGGVCGLSFGRLFSMSLRVGDEDRRHLGR